ncbi:hypothetical protein MHU86_25072 [Fragilaria crotonensis]|nr:hypothetical protein MHU86_25072 [Fragilaria crotonensis]
MHVEDDFHAENGGDLWHLRGMVAQRQRSSLIDWAKMEDWTSVNDGTTEQNKDAERIGQPKEDGMTMSKKQAKKRSAAGGQTRATKTPTSKLHEYRKMLMVERLER